MIGEERLKKIRSMTTDEKIIQSAIFRADGYSYTALTKIFKVPEKTIRKWLSSSISKTAMKERQREIRLIIQKVFSGIDKQFEELVNRYMQRLLDEDRIDKMGLMGLASIIDSMTNNYKKMHDMNNNFLKYRVERERLKLEKENAKLMRELKLGSNSEENDNSIIENFYNQLQLLKTPNLFNDIQTEHDITKMTTEDLIKLRNNINKQVRTNNRIEKEKNCKRVNVDNE